LFWINAISLAAAALLSLACLLYLSFAVAMANFSVKSTYAALTAPRVDIRSSVASHRVQLLATTGSSINRDDPVARLDGTLIDVQIETLRTSNGKWNTTSAPDELPAPEPPLRPIKASDESLPSTMPSSGGDAARSELAVLELRKSLLEMRSPCRCLVLWTAADGQAVNAGGLIAILARVGANDLRVDAFIPVEMASTVVKGQFAYIRDPESGRVWSARVNRVRLGDDAGPRAGMPAVELARSTLAAVELTLKDIPEPEFLGKPLEVMFRKWW
jgi:hypothetical protein